MEIRWIVRYARFFSSLQPHSSHKKVNKDPILTSFIQNAMKIIFRNPKGVEVCVNSKYTKMIYVNHFIDICLLLPFPKRESRNYWQRSQIVMKLRINKNVL